MYVYIDSNLIQFFFSTRNEKIESGADFYLKDHVGMVCSRQSGFPAVVALQSLLVLGSTRIGASDSRD